MTDFLFLILLILGACVGSSLCCQVRRFSKKKKPKWSQCEHCKKKLTWRDKVPILSWVALGGRCRYCKEKIGVLELTCEIGGALAFVTLFLFWPIELGGTRGIADGDIKSVVLFVLALGFLSLLGYLAILDIRKREVPQRALCELIVLGGLFWILREAFYGGSMDTDVLSLLLGIVILAGLYFVLYKISKEKLVGGAEWMVGAAMALMLAKWELALLCLVISNVAAAVIILNIKSFLNKKIEQVPMLIFLLLGFLLTLSIFFDFYVG